MKPARLKDDIYWVGAVDWDLRNFHGYLTQRGSTYNAYLIVDEKVVLVDTVKHYLFDEMMERLRCVIDPAEIDIVVCNHVEMDHSGSLPKIMEVCPDATVFTSPNGQKGLAAHYDISDWGIKTVDSGDTLNIGKRNLNFVLTQMVHWPDSMATYVPEEKLLLPNDAFGQHIASAERFDDEFGWDIVEEEAAKYYANIVLPYGGQVKKALEALSGLEIDMIAPSHGLVWRTRIRDIIEKYSSWANNDTDEKATIVYDTMWGSTGKIAGAIEEGLERKGITSYVADLKATHISDVMTRLMTSKYICVGSPTLNNGMLPNVAAFLTYMKGLAPKGRTGMAFGSYGWGGQSVGQIEEVFKGCGFDIMESVKVKWVPGEDEIKGITEKVKGGLK